MTGRPLAMKSIHPFSHLAGVVLDFLILLASLGAFFASRASWYTSQRFELDYQHLDIARIDLVGSDDSPR
jgi:hypothetical protein